MPYLASISIYPIKSLEPMLLPQARVLRSGALLGDRTLALIDEHGKFINGKRTPLVHRLRSSFDPTARILRLGRAQTGLQVAFHIDRQKQQLQDWLHEFFGMPVSVAANSDVGFPDDLESPGPTIISTATLIEVASWFPNLDAHSLRLRLRANLEIGGVPPFWEDRLFGERGMTVRFCIGDVLFDGINPCQRCIVPARDPMTGQESPDFAKRFVEMRRRCLPDWADASRFNHYYRLAVNTRLAHCPAGAELKVGDSISILGPMGSRELANPKPALWTGQLRVDRVIRETPTTSTFRLAPVEAGALPFAHLPGQFLMLSVEINGTRHRRSYTIASSPTQSNYCEITVKRQQTGTVSAHLHHQVRPGDLLNVSAPAGKFTFNGTEAQHLVLIAAGVGITPLMSQIRFLTDRNWPGRIHLIYSARTQPDIIFRKELLELAAQFPNLRLTITLTDEQSPGWNGPRGRITPELLSSAIDRDADQRFHICGPTEFAQSIKSTLAALAVAPECIDSEAFGGGKKPRPTNGTASPPRTINFTASNKSARITSDQCILDAADAIGVPIDHGCLAGICGRCKVKLVTGEVEMPVEDGLSDHDKINGYVLACQATALSHLIIDA